MFKDFDIEIGGKTGSAEAVNGVNAWFVGFAPYDNPEIAIVVMIENGSHGSYSAHVAKDVIEQHFKLQQVEEENRIALPYEEQQN